MKGVILHGGKGTRLRPLTHTGPKQLIKVGGKPISQWGIENLVRHGITDIAIVLGENNPEKVIDYYGDGTEFSANFTYIYQGEARGLAEAIYRCKDFVGNDRFIVHLGDNIVQHGLELLVNTKNEAAVLLAKVTDPSRYGVAEVKHDRIVRLVEKPKEFVSDLALVGVYSFTDRIFDIIEGLKPSKRGELEITEAIEKVIESGEAVGFSIVDGWWKDTGTPDDMLSANMRILDFSTDYKIHGIIENSNIEGRVYLGKNSKIIGSTVRGPAYIGENTIIEGSFVGSYMSIGDGCKICNTEISNSLVFDHSKISDCKLTDSIIGYNCNIEKNRKKPEGSRLITGEGSSVSI